MRKIGVSVFLFVNVVLMGYGFFAFKTTCYKNTRVILEISGGVPDRYQLFYNAGFGIKERESVNFFLESANTGIVEFTIPGSWFRQLRIDPGTRPAHLRIRKITIFHAENQICLEGESLSQNLFPLNQVEMGFENDELVIKSTGNDPYFAIAGDTIQRIDFTLNKRNFIFLVMTFMVLFAGAMAMFVYFDRLKNKADEIFQNPLAVVNPLLTLKPQKFFVYTAFIWGLISVFVIPPFQSPDEFSHFYRIYELSTFQIMPVVERNNVGGYVPKSIVEIMSEYHKVPFHPENKVQLQQIMDDFTVALNPEESTLCFHFNSYQYIPLPYVPQAVILMIPVLFEPPPLLLLYLGRIGNLLCWILLVYFAIGITPVHKWVFIMLAFLPMSVFQVSSLSPDATTFALSFLFIAYVLKISLTENHKVDFLEMAKIFILAFFLSLSKNVYFVITAFILVIPRTRFTSLRRFLFFQTGTFLVVLLALFLTQQYLSQIITQLDITNGLYSGISNFPNNIYPQKQLVLMLENIPGYFSVMVRTLVNYANKIANGWVGNIGWHDTPLPGIFVLYVYIALIIIALNDKNPGLKIEWWQRIVVLFIAVSVYVSAGTALYLSWTPLGDKMISGFQGRYLIPAGPLGFLLFYNRRLQFSQKYLPDFVLLNIVVFFVVTMYTLLSRYYF